MTFPLILWLSTAAHVQHVELPESDVLFHCTAKRESAAEDRETSCLALRHREGSKVVLFLSSSTLSLRFQDAEEGHGIVGPWRLPGAPSQERVLELRRTGDRLRLRADEQWLGEVGDVQGKGGIVAATGDVWKLLECRIQPLGEISFSDDFMREAGRQGAWEFQGDGWSVDASHHPELSAAPFSLKGRAEQATLALAGHAFWDDYACQASVRAETPGTSLGMVFSWKGASRYHLLEWQTEGRGRDMGSLCLYRVRPEEKKLLAKRECPLPLGRWFALSLAQTGPDVVCAVGGVEVLEAEDVRLTGGKIGLYVEGGTALFDDVEARDVPAGSNARVWLDLSQRSRPRVPPSFQKDEYMKAWAAPAPDWANAVLPESKAVDYTFYKAPVDWIPAAGRWRVARRWVCLPRFNWMRGDGDDLCLLWHAWRFQGDIAAEAVCANAMTGRPMPHYDWGVNRCISICADGRDPLSGYTFVWGGPDFPCRLVKKGTVVAETGKLIVKGFRKDHDRLMRELHKNWTGLTLRKRQGRIEALLDGEPLLSFEDTDPIEAGYVAVWAWKHPLLLARTRIAYTEAARPSWREQGIERPPGLVRQRLDIGPFRVREEDVLSFQVKPDKDSTLHLVLETVHGPVAGSLCGQVPVHPSVPSFQLEPLPRDGQWHTVKIPLLKVLESIEPWKEDWEVLETGLLDLGKGHQYIPWMGWRNSSIQVREESIVRCDPCAAPDEGRLPPPPVLDLNPDPRLFQDTFEGPIRDWRRYGCASGARPIRLAHEGRPNDRFLRAVNETYGGCFGLRIPCPPYDSGHYPWIHFDGRLVDGAQVNLLVQIEGVWEQMSLSGTNPYRKPFGSVAAAEKKGEWRSFTACPGKNFLSASKPCQAPIVQGLAFSDVGLWSHVSGDHYDLDNVYVLSDLPSDRPILVTPRAPGISDFEGSLQGPDPGKETPLETDENGVFRLSELSPGRYRLSVWSLGRHGSKGPPATIPLVIREPWKDEEPPVLSGLSHEDNGLYGDKTVRFKLEDALSGVNRSSVALKVNDASYSLSDGTMRVSPCSGEWIWEGDRLGKEIYDGQVVCELFCEDRAGNALGHQWKWTFDSSRDHEGPAIGYVCSVRSPFAAWQEFGTGPEGWRDFDNVVVDWGPYSGPAGDPCLHYRQPRGGGLHSGLMGIPPFSAREWPQLSFDALVQEGGQPSVLARVNDADWKIGLAKPVRAGEWSSVQVDLETALDQAGLEDDKLRVELLTLQFEKSASLYVDNVCLSRRHPRTVRAFWRDPADATGVSLYRWSCSESPDGSVEKGQLTARPDVTIPLPQDAAPAFLHLQARDGAGNWGPVFHQRLDLHDPALSQIKAEEFR